jgi:predicted amidohydrolase YtcJ
MNRRRRIIFLMSFLILTIPGAQAQNQVDMATQLGYPQTIVYNAKIVTIDDEEVNENLGRTVQAMAIRDGKFLAVGTNAEVRALAGPNTDQVDMKGRLIIPGFVITHEHPNDWMYQEPTAWENTLPMETDRYQVHWMQPGPAEKVYENFWSTLREMVSRAKPDQWILLNMDRATNLAWGEDTNKYFNAVEAEITKEFLDEVAPDHPVLIHSGGAMSVINSKAMEVVEEVYPNYEDFAPSGGIPLDMYSDRIEPFKERPVSILNRGIMSRIVLDGDYREVAKLLKGSLELWAAYGMTTFASSPYSPVTFQAFSHLDRQGEMPVRYGWGYQGPDFSESTLRTVAGLLGHGSDYMWNIGAWGTLGSSCTSIDAPEEIKRRERCSFTPGSVGREVLNRIIRTGGRVATMHTDGDQDIDYLLDAIEEESAKAGFSLEEIRAKRQTFDHLDGAPRPDQIPRIKNLGMTLSGQNWYLLSNGFNTGASGYARTYGEEYACWVVPRKSLFDAGIKVGWEVDKPVPWLIFQRVLDGMTRYNTRYKRVYCPEERTSRIIQLKAMTVWGAYYMLRENQIGSITPGKLADYLVLDRDFFTIPDEEIPLVRVLMTVVGGKTVHMMPSLATDLGIQPVGPVTWRNMTLPYLSEAR